MHYSALLTRNVSEDPRLRYTGQPFHYRISTGEEIENIGTVRAGQAIIWSTGPDGVDDGGKKDGLLLGDRAKAPAGFDLITVMPYWP